MKYNNFKLFFPPSYFYIALFAYYLNALQPRLVKKKKKKFVMNLNDLY